MLDFGILGMNARNLQYIKKFNPAKAIRLADNKFKTKRFLGDRGIPVPHTYDLIKNRDQLYSYDFSQLPVDEFIVKPVKGSRGRGIYRVKLVDDAAEAGVISRLGFMDTVFRPTSPYLDQAYKVSGNIIDDVLFRRYLVDILDGKNSLTTKGDHIMLEELIVPGSGFEKYCEHGLADIRVIVFNLIPVAAMLRVPTPASDGKANLDRGALGMGVEVGSGKIYAMYEQGKIYTKEFPPLYSQFAHQYLPYRDDILSYSSKIQYFANLGYLALDWVITEEGPKLLEINARAGLKFQNASLLPLRKRLDKIKDIHVTTPEKGVEIAQTLFTKQKGPVISSSKILYLRQDASFHLIEEASGEKKVQDVVVEIDLQKKRNYLSKNLYQKLKKMQGEEMKIATHISFSGKGKVIKIGGEERKEAVHGERDKIILGKEAVAEYYIKPIEKISLALDFVHPKHLQKSEIDQLHLLDKKLATLGRILNLSRILHPVNMLEQLDNFITHRGNYNPVFVYRRPSDTKLEEVATQLDDINDIYFGSNKFQSAFATLFEEKFHELQHKYNLIKAYKTQDYANILHYNHLLYKPVHEDYLRIAKEKVFSETTQDRSLLGKKLSVVQIKNMIESYVESKGLTGVRVKFVSDGAGRISVRRGKNIDIQVAYNAGFREKELMATLAHEVDVHIMRHVAGQQTGRQLFKAGTAGYIADEEGLAVLTSEQYLPEGYEKQGMYMKYYLLSQAGVRDFSSLAGLVQALTSRPLINVFKAVLRLKRGITDTSHVSLGALYTKDKVYLDGYMHINERKDAGNDLEQLMIGKVKIDDLQFIL